MAKSTLITFDQQGNIMVDQQGFTGVQCEEATKLLIGSIGAQVKHDTKKPEFNARAGTTAKQSQGW